MRKSVDSSTSTTRNLTWDDENRLTKVSDVYSSTSKNTTFAYDADGTRVIKSGNLGDVLYVNNNYSIRNNEIISKHVFAGNTRIVSKLYVNNGTTVTDKGSYYYHGDHLGSSSVITDNTGKFYEHILYFPYGEDWIDEKASSSSDGVTYKYTAKEYDAETGFYYHGARYRDAILIAWNSIDKYLSDGKYLPKANDFDTEHDYYWYLSQDASKKLPGIGGVFNSVNLNPYNYAGNNPVKFIDPDGNENILLVKSKNPINSRFESDALIYKDNTFKGLKFGFFKAWAAVKGFFGGSVGKSDAEFFLGKADKTFNNFSTLSDDPSKYGTAAQGVVYDYKKATMDIGIPGLKLNNGGGIPQDPSYNKGINPNIAERPSEKSLDSVYIHGARIDWRRNGAGSHGCPTRAGMGEVFNYLDSTPTGNTGKALIYR